MGAAVAAALVLALGAPSPGGDPALAALEVRVLARLHPTAVELDGPRRVRVEVRDGGLTVDGAAVDGELELPHGRWTVRVVGSESGRQASGFRLQASGEAPDVGTGSIRPGVAEARSPEPVAGFQGSGTVRRYVAALRVASAAGELRIVARMDLEEYVADVTASETDAGTPFEALAAQAIVVRSYALAATGRHAGGELCDLAHCQVLSAGGASGHRAAAREAARSTAGLVLRLPAGEIAQAPFHAACGGHTADPVETFGGPDRSGAAAVPDPGCPARPWDARLPWTEVERVAASLLGAPPGSSRDAGPRLVAEAGAGGFVARVGDARTGLWIRGEAFARALDAALGRGVVRSPRFRLETSGEEVRLRGTGHGHGVGLCQAGAARLAREGHDRLAILHRYFPGARVSPGAGAGAAAAEHAQPL